MVRRHGVRCDGTAKLRVPRGDPQLRAKTLATHLAHETARTVGRPRFVGRAVPDRFGGRRIRGTTGVRHGGSPEAWPTPRPGRVVCQVRVRGRGPGPSIPATSSARGRFVPW